MSNTLGYITGTLFLVFFSAFPSQAQAQASEHATRKSNGKRHLASLLYAKPNHNNPYYWVAVGEDNGVSFVTYFNFYIYIHERKILYLDNDSGDAIDLATWRRRLLKK